MFEEQQQMFMVEYRVAKESDTDPETFWSISSRDTKDTVLTIPAPPFALPLGDPAGQLRRAEAQRSLQQAQYQQKADSALGLLHLWSKSVTFGQAKATQLQELQNLNDKSTRFVAQVVSPRRNHLYRYTDQYQVFSSSFLSFLVQAAAMPADSDESLTDELWMIVYVVPQRLEDSPKALFATLHEINSIIGLMGYNCFGNVSVPELSSGMCLIGATRIQFCLAKSVKLFEAKAAQPFESLPKLMTQVDVMHMVGDFLYCETPLAHVLGLQSKTHDFVFFLFVPTFSLESFERHLTGKEVLKMVSLAKRSKVEVTMPRLKITKCYELAPQLQYLGLSTCFEASANFSAMCGDNKTLISKVFHRTSLEIQTASSKCVEYPADMDRLSEHSLSVNKSFYYGLINKDTGSLMVFSCFDNKDL